MAIISDDFVRRLTLGTRSEVVIRDARAKGFTLRVRRRADSTLSRAYFLIQELPAGPEGKRRRRKIVIGDGDTFTADQARAEAEDMLRAIARGEDPATARHALRTAPVFEDLEREFETHIAGLKPGSQADYRGRVKRHIGPEFKGQRVADIALQQVRDWHRKRGKQHPTDANRNLAIFSKMMSHAIELGWRTDNPAKAIKRNKERVRDAWLDEHDWPLFVEGLRAATGPYAAMARFLTVTGWRISEAKGLRWEQVDLRRMTASLADTKTGPQIRQLSTDAVSILEAQGHRRGYVFSKRGTMALDAREVRSLLVTICSEAGIRSITPHALRHNAATWAAIDGAQAAEIRDAFGWKTLAMASRYVSRSESLGRRGVQRAADALNIFGRSLDVKKPPAAEI